jgi:hypothetical protein
MVDAPRQIGKAAAANGGGGERWRARLCLAAPCARGDRLSKGAYHARFARANGKIARYPLRGDREGRNEDPAR